MTNEHKPERIHGGHNTPASMFILEAMVAAADRDDDSFMQEFFPDGLGDGHVDVVLLVNGKQVPFKTVAQGFWDRALADLDGRARAMAREMLSEAGLDGIHDALREAEWKIQDAISARFPD